MSLTSSSNLLEFERDNLIDRICKRSQRLRNAMVQSILNHDPFNTDVISYPISISYTKSRFKQRLSPQYDMLWDNYTTDTSDKLKAFLKGDSMDRKDEIEACETLKSMSEDDLCKTTNLVYKVSNNKCSCNTCLRYEKEDFNCDLMRSNDKSCCNNCGEVQNKNHDNSPKSQHNIETYEYMEYVNCMRVTVQELVLNDNANKKLHSDFNSNKKAVAIGTQTFFIEYELPFIFSVCSRKKTVKKFTSRKQDNTVVRICARRLSTEAIIFKQTSVHNIENMDNINLQGIEMKFQISCRMMKQKTSIVLGYSLFKFDKFYSSSNLTCIEELPITFTDSIPIVVGKLRILLEMGYGGVYFGREFIASLKETPESKSIDEVKSEKQESTKTSPQHLQQNLCREKQKNFIASSNSKNGLLSGIAPYTKFKAGKYNIVSVDKTRTLKNCNSSVQTDIEVNRYNRGK